MLIRCKTSLKKTIAFQNERLAISLEDRIAAARKLEFQFPPDSESAYLLIFSELDRPNATAFPHYNNHIFLDCTRALMNLYRFKACMSDFAASQMGNSQNSHYYFGRLMSELSPDLEWASEPEPLQFWGLLYNDIGKYYLWQGRFKEAELYLLKADRILESPSYENPTRIFTVSALAELYTNPDSGLRAGRERILDLCNQAINGFEVILLSNPGITPYKAVITARAIREKFLEL